MEFNPTEWRRFEGAAHLQGLLVGTDSISPWTTRAEHNKRLHAERGLVSSLIPAQAFAVQNIVNETPNEELYNRGEHLRMLFDIRPILSGGLHVTALTGEVGTELGYHSINPETSAKYLLRNARKGLNGENFLSKLFTYDIFGKVGGAQTAVLLEGVWPVTRDVVNYNWSLYAGVDVGVNCSRWVGSEKNFVNVFGEDAVNAVPTITASEYKGKTRS